MGQEDHSGSYTDPADRARIRAEVQRSEESLRVLAKRYQINEKTVAKWKQREGTDDARRGTKKGVFTALTSKEEAVAVAFRRYTRAPLDTCLAALRPMIPNLTRSSLHRCYQRHGISNNAAPEVTEKDEAGKNEAGKNELQMDVIELRVEFVSQYLFVAVGPDSKIIDFVLRQRSTPAIAIKFLRQVIAKLPCEVQDVSTKRRPPFLDAFYLNRKISKFTEACENLNLAHYMQK